MANQHIPTIDEVLTRGVEKIYPSKDGLAKLMSEKKLTLYQGFDPTGDMLHIGHMVAFKKLRQFQLLGHKVIFLIGDGTGQAGDPSGKKKTREKFFTREELRENARNYVMQAGKIVDFEGDNPVEIKYNGDWLNKLTLIDILNIAQVFSVQQLTERDMFQERLKNNESINLREFLYPLLQGYDSVAMNVDLEIGGSDQTFNMLCGRTLVEKMLNKEKFVLTTPLLTDANGVKIGKSEGNVIGLTDEPSDFYGKVMALADSSIIPCLTLLTDLSLEEISKVQKAMTDGENPMTFKKMLAHTLTETLNSKEEADKAQENFENTFQKGEIVANEEIEVSNEAVSIIDLVTKLNLVSSKSEAKRLITSGAIELDKKTIDNPQETVTPKGKLLKLGKKRYINLV